MSTERQKRVQARAYEIWEREGRDHGNDAQHWMQAEREIGNEDAVAAKSPKKAAPRKSSTAAAKTVKVAVKGAPSKARTTTKA